MKYNLLKNEKRFKNLLSVITASAVILGSYCNFTYVTAAEQIEKSYKGITNAKTVLKNLDYTDVKLSGTWAAEAIYETGALSVIRGYGNSNFGRTDVMTKEQAIAIAYRVAGREADAMKAAEELDKSRGRDEKRKNVFDGYLKLAADDELISAEDLIDAFNPDQTSLGNGSFYRGASAQRQEVAFWIAKALKIEPIYNQQAIYNTFNDWKNADPAKIPYIQAILKSSIMNGDGYGYFNPGGSLTREQAAQIVKNASNFVLPALNCEKNVGTIEDINLSRTFKDGQRLETAVLNIRNINGKLHRINVGYVNDPSISDRNEQSGQLIGPEVLDLVVYKNGILSNSTSLEKGDRIEYIASEDNTVKYVKVFSSTTDTEYVVTQVKSVNSDNLTIDVSHFFTLETPDIITAQKYISFSPGKEKPLDSYLYSNNVTVRIDGRITDIKNLKSDAIVLLTVVNDMITAIESFDLSSIREEERGIVSGMVEENNPHLGYITLYREDGTGTSPEAARAGFLRTYYYSGGNSVVAYRNHNKANIDEITAGDSVFLKLDNDGRNVLSASAISNYIIKYGKIISKGPLSIAVEYEDGLQQVLDVDDRTIVTSEGKAVEYDALKDGDAIRLVMQVTSNVTRVKEISVADAGIAISNIYKGIVSFIDNMSNSVVLQNLEVLDRDRWQRTEQKGFTHIKLDEQYSIYSQNQSADVDKVNKLLKGREAYIAVEKDFGGEEKAVLISFKNGQDPEMPVIYDDTISGVGHGMGQFILYKENKKMKYAAGTIVVKDGRLVAGSSIKNYDDAYIVASMSNTSGDLYADVINIGERFYNNMLQVYRGEIQKINTNKDFTVKSFSELKGLKWDFWNTPKTYSITYNTRILGDSGVVNQREFTGYGQGSYVGKKVFVIAKDGEALLISTAPFSDPFNVKGEIYETDGGSELKLWNTKVYDPYNFIWKDSKEITLSILKNSVIIKGDNIISASDLKNGDRIMAVKRNNTAMGDAYIIFVEN